MNSPETRKICGYGRVSTGNDRQAISIEAQNRQMIDYARAQGVELDPETALFLEDGVSGSIEFQNRRKGAAVLRAFRDGVFNVMIVPKIDRLGRNAFDTITTIETIKKLGGEIWILDLGGSTFKTSDAIAGMIIAVLAYGAQVELERIRERIRSAFEHKRSNGELCSHPPYGWDPVPTGRKTKSGGEVYTSKPNDIEQSWLRWMFECRFPGVFGGEEKPWSYKRIADELNRLGVPTKVPAGTPIKTRTGETRLSSGLWNQGNVHNVMHSSYALEMFEELKRGALLGEQQAA